MSGAVVVEDLLTVLAARRDRRGSVPVGLVGRRRAVPGVMAIPCAFSLNQRMFRLTSWGCFGDVALNRRQLPLKIGERQTVLRIKRNDFDRFRRVALMI